MTQVTVYELLTILKQQGFKEVSKKNNHHKFLNNDGQMVTFYYLKHSDYVPTGTYRAILKQINFN